MADVTLTYEDGTVRIEVDSGARLDEAEVGDLRFVEPDARSKTLRAPAFRYAALRARLDDRGVAVEDRVLDASDFPEVASSYELREYQREALDAWAEADRRSASAHASEVSGDAKGRDQRGAADPGFDTPRNRDRWGVLELPTGSGKTVIGLKAIERLQTATLVVVPTIDLLEQWRRELEREFEIPVGQMGGGEQTVEPLTVSTYDSAYLRADDLGDRFGLAIFDEVHHLGGEGYRDIARLLAAPSRMGLTATFERPDGAHEVVADLVGPRAYAIDPEDLAGEHLAPYDLKRVEVELTDEERERYEAATEVFTNYLAKSNIRMQSGSDYRELVKRSGSDPEAREALLAKQRAREVMMNSDAKVDALETVLDRHRDDRVIVFTAHNDLVYRLSERFLLPAVTHRTGAAERREILDRFREGTYSRVVTSNVLDEGVDVPDANVAVVLSGSGSEREFTQRLGRILRPNDGGRAALLYEVVSSETAEERVAERRR